jgi:carboxyl-terminal processing protease
VGIGAALSIQDGYPVINQLLPGTPAQLSGQLQPGDRIVALAQGDSAFVDVHSLPLSDVVNLIRGAPGTTLQLQVLPADAPPGSSPRVIPIVRDQLKFKN